MLLIASLCFFCVNCVSSATEKKNAEKSGKLELSRQFVESGQMEKAVSVLQELSRQHPEDSGVHYLYGLALLGLKDIGAAKFRFEKAVSLDKDNDDARLSFGYTLIVLKEYKRAKGVLSEIVDRNTYSYMERAFVNLGLNELEQENCTEALGYFERAINLDPTLVTAYFNKGKCLVKLGKIRQAFEAFEKAVGFCPGCGEPQLEFARVQFQLGMRKEAISNLQELLKSAESGETRRRARELLSKMNRKNGRTR
jgi:tetratricopeptide (TPR) repeat protein